MSFDKNQNLLINITGIAYLHSFLASVTDGNNQYCKKVFLKPGKLFKSVYFTPGSASMEETEKQENAGMLIDQVVRFVVPGEDEDNTELLADIRNHPLLIKVMLCGGEKKLIGLPSNPARFSRKMKFSDKGSSTEITFSCSNPEPAWWISYEGPEIPH